MSNNGNANDATNIEALLARKYGKVRKGKGKKGPELIINCPFCRHKFKVYVNVMHGIFHCFRCGESGSVDRLISYTPNRMNVEVAETIKPLPTDTVMPGTLVDLHGLDSEHPALKYLSRRKFDPVELNDVFGVRYCETGRVFAGRYDTTNTLIFPMWMNNRIIGWQSRLLYDPDKLTESEMEMMGIPQDEDGDWVKPPKYWTSPGLEKGRILFNYDWASTSDVVVICEGTFDAMAVGKCGVATLGKGVTEMQARLIKTYWKAAVILLDPGDAEEEMVKLVNSLHREIPVIKVDLQGYKDAGEAPRRAIWEQIIATAEKAEIDLFKYNIAVQ